MKTFAAFLITLVIGPVICLGQALADRVPADALVYVGWNGTDAPGAAYDQSHFKAVLDSSDVRRLIHDSIPKLMERISAMDPQSGQAMRIGLDVIASVAPHPTAVYFGGISQNNQQGPLPVFALICDAGDGAGALSDRISQLITGAPPFIQCKAIGSLVVLSSYAFVEHPDKPLSQDVDFQAAMGSLTKDPFLAFYMNGAATMTLTDQMVGQFSPPEVQQQWPQIKTALGIDGLKMIAGTCGFEGKNWVGELTVGAPAPRHGLLALSDTQPLRDDILKLIPATSSLCGAGSLDLDALFGVVDKSIQQFAPMVYNDFANGVQQANTMSGIDIDKDLLAAFGAQWGFYVDPTTAGNGILGFTLVNRPRDAAKLEASLGKVEQMVNGLLQQQLAQSKMTMEFRQMDVNGAHVHYFSSPLVSPTWTIKDGTWYFSLFPQMVTSALNRPADAKTILDNAGFQNVMKELGAPAKYNGFGYMDLTQTMPQGYQTWLMISRLYLGFGDMAGGQIPPLVVPPLDKIMAETQPAGRVEWVDDAGFHLKAVTPFPGADILGAGDSMSAGMLGETAMMTSILLPSLNRARETDNRIKCASNEHQIGQGLLLYQTDMKGAYPPDLGTLAKNEDMNAAVFVCPSSGSPTPPGNLTADQIAQWINDNSDYVYIGSGLKAGVDPNTVVLYEKDGDHGGDGMNLLFADGHVEFMTMDEARQAIEKSKNASGAAAPAPAPGM